MSSRQVVLSEKEVLAVEGSSDDLRCRDHRFFDVQRVSDREQATPTQPVRPATFPVQKTLPLAVRDPGNPQLSTALVVLCFAAAISILADQVHQRGAKIFECVNKQSVCGDTQLSRPHPSSPPGFEPNLCSTEAETLTFKGRSDVAASPTSKRKMILCCVVPAWLEQRMLNFDGSGMSSD